jgi:hypothetical protein
MEELTAKHVETVRISGHTKRWWTTDLASAQATFRSLKLKSWKLRGEPDHPVHAEARTSSTTYHQLIDETKALCWKKFIENARDFSLWLVHKVVTGTGSDGGCTRLPALRDSERDMFVTENQEKAHVLHKEFFPPPPPVNPALHENTDGEYPEDVEAFSEITDEQIQRAITRMESWKAVMKGDIPNHAVKVCSKVLTPYLGEIYRASFCLNHYPSNWKIYDTVVLRKPDQEDYTLPNAYRPICLLKTIAKPLSIAVTEYISYLAEEHQLLPATHFGFCPGRATTDALLAVDKFVKDAWQDGDVVSGLFFDVKGAFPSVHVPRLMVDLQRKGIPTEITRWLEKKLNGRHTVLVFDGHRSAPMTIHAGLDQGCPLSGCLYNFYNAALGEIARNVRRPHRILIPGFADDIALFARGKSFLSTCRTLGDLLRREGGVLEWAKQHNCIYAKKKWALVDFTHKTITAGNRCRSPLRGPRLRIDNEVSITPQDSTRYLGVILHFKLSWTQQWNLAIARGTKWTMAVTRMMKSKMGVQMQFARQMYIAVCLPKMLYAAELWATPRR